MSVDHGNGAGVSAKALRSIIENPKGYTKTELLWQTVEVMADILDGMCDQMEALAHRLEQIESGEPKTAIDTTPTCESIGGGASNRVYTGSVLRRFYIDGTEVSERFYLAVKYANSDEPAPLQNGTRNATP